MQINKTHPLARGLVGCWVMNEQTGDKVFDLSGNDNTGTITGADWVADGLDFGASSDNSKYISVTASQIINLPVSGNFSIVLSGTPNYGNQASRAIISWGGADDFIFYPNDNSNGIGGMRVFWRDTGGNTINYDGADLIGVKTQFTYTSAPTAQIGYQDGIQVGSSSPSLAGVGPFNSFRIGNWTDSIQPFGGDVQYVYIYNRALSAEEVAWLNREPYAMFEQPISPASLYYEAAPPVGAIMNQFQGANIGADLFNGALL
jgi:hypothetical protein